MTRQRSGRHARLALRNVERIARARRFQRWVILIERITQKLIWPLIIFVFYGTISLFRVPQQLPDPLHSGLALAIVALLAGLLLHGLNRVRRPTRSYVDRRLEKGSALHDRPLATMEDTPVHPARHKIWQTHVERSVARIGTLRPSICAFDVSRRTLALLLAGFSALSIGFYNAGSHALSRLEAGFLPGMDDDDTPLPEIHAWVTPPSYAPGPPIYLEGGSSNVTVAPRADLEVHIIGARAIPWLVGAVDPRVTTKRLGPQSWRLTEKLQRNGDVSLRARGRVIAQWKVHLLSDPAPIISWKGKPKIEADALSVLVRYNASQPFGIASVSLSISPEKGASNQKIVTFFDTSPAGKHKFVGHIREDVSRLPFAGERVKLRLKAVSVSGNVAESEARVVTLPAYPFFNPTSRALIALRRRILHGQEDVATAREELASLLSLVTPREKGVALLALQLMRGDKSNMVRLGDGLWVMAIYLDDLSRQGRAIAEANLALRSAQNALIRTLGKAYAPSSAQQESIERQKRIDDLKNAISRRIQILMYHAMEQSGMVPDTGRVVPGRNDAVTQLLNRLQDHASDGDRNAAMKNLRDLERMTQRIRYATPEELEAAAKQEEADQKARLHMRVVQDLVKRETQILDATQSRNEVFLRNQEMQRDPGLRFDHPINLRSFALGASDTSIELPPHERSASTDAEEASRQDQRRDRFITQGALREAVRALIAEISVNKQQVPNGMKKAARHMGRVRQSLAQRDDFGASQSLKDVIADLTQAEHDMRTAQKDKLHGDGPIILLPTMRAGGDESGQQKDGPGRGDESDDETDSGSASHKASDKKDPLGRKVNDGQGASEAEQERAIEQNNSHRLDIEREIRRRAADRGRPSRERHYLEDLLKAWREGD